MTFPYLILAFCAQDCKFRVLIVTYWVNWALFLNYIQRFWAFCTRSRMFLSFEFCEMYIVAGFPLFPLLKSCTKCISTYSSSANMSGILANPPLATQHDHSQQPIRCSCSSPQHGVTRYELRYDLTVLLQMSCTTRFCSLVSKSRNGLSLFDVFHRTLYCILTFFFFFGTRIPWYTHKIIVY